MSQGSFTFDKTCLGLASLLLISLSAFVSSIKYFACTHIETLREVDGQLGLLGDQKRFRTPVMITVLSRRLRDCINTVFSPSLALDLPCAGKVHTLGNDPSTIRFRK
jgi:hypothetical protein